jgi:hypothetical protein
MSKKKWLGSTPVCDFCKAQEWSDLAEIQKEEFFVDGKTIFGPWALLCEDHFHTLGAGLGTGLGQKYAWDEMENTWVKTEG